MRCSVALCAVLFVCSLAFAQKSHPAAPEPTQFEIGRLTFFDFGPPFHYYDIFVVRPTSGGASVERISLTPGDECRLPAKVETSSAVLHETVESLLQPNPCAIPEKELRHEIKRCKKCVVFSGADVTMRVQCGSSSRLIRSAILDRDIFGSRANTPKNTSWTMDLLSKLDGPLAPTAMDKPAFSPFEDKIVEVRDGPGSSTEQAVASGAYDGLFESVTVMPSSIYREAQEPLPAPTISILNSSPVQPVSFVLPDPSPLGRATQFTGVVMFSVDVDGDGVPTNFMQTKGPPFLRASLEQAALQWRFPKDLSHLQVRAAIWFEPGCKKKSEAAAP